MAKEKKEKTTSVKDINSIIDGLASKNPKTFFSGEDAALEDDRISFDSPTLTWLYGGFKMNAIHRFNGKESGGKTTMCTIIAGQCQKRRFERYGNYSKSHVAIIDYERSFDVIHAQKLGLILKDPETGEKLVHVIRPVYMEDGEVWWEQIVESGQLCCTILDSDNAGANHTEFDTDELGKATFGAQAKACGMVIKRMNIFVSKHCTPVLWISQERANQELMAHLPKTTGGEAVNFYPSTRFRVTPGKPADYPTNKDGDVIGYIVKMTNYKNKTAKPFRKGELTVMYNSGLSVERDYINMIVKLGVIEQHGAWFYIFNPLKDMDWVKKEQDPKLFKKACDAAVESGDLVKCSGMDNVVVWWNSKDNMDWKEFLKKDVLERCMKEDDAILDADTHELDEEVEFQKEQAEAAALREQAAEKAKEEAKAKVAKEAELSATEQADAEAGPLETHGEDVQEVDF